MVAFAVVPIGCRLIVSASCVSLLLLFAVAVCNFAGRCCLLLLLVTVASCLALLVTGSCCWFLLLFTLIVAMRVCFLMLGVSKGANVIIR